MATRFGGTKGHNSQVRTLAILAVLVFIILVALGGVLFVALKVNSGQEQPNLVPDIAVSTVPQDNVRVVPKIEVVAASIRIEEGAAITNENVKIVNEEQSRVPSGAILAREKLQYMNYFITRSYNPDQIITRDSLSTFQPLSTLKIPPGFRAVTITVDNRSGIEGWAKPGTRVDIIWTFSENNTKKVATVVRQAEVLSVGGARGIEGERVEMGGPTTVTIKVTEQDAKKIELARSLGELSLTLVSPEEPERPSMDSPEVIDIRSLIGDSRSIVSEKGEVVEAPEKVIVGTMYAPDPVTGKMRRFTLEEGKNKWVPDNSFDE